MARMIIHIDLDAFFCAVEELHNPALRRIPFAVGGRPDQRGVVASCSYPARAFGVRSAMPMSRALSLCPELEIIPARHGEYGVHSRKVMAILRDLTPLVEQLSIDEAFIDVTGHPDAGYPLAVKLQTQINQNLSLPVSLGVASNKLIAKTANTIGKAEASQHTDHPPNAIKVIPPGEEAAFLAPLDIRELWGIGPKTADRLRGLNIHTIGDIAAYNPAVLQTFFGKHGTDLHRRAQGVDTRRVTPEHETKSISKETTFAEDVRDRDTLQRTVRRLADGVGLRLRRDDLYGTTVKIKLRWSDFTTITRQTTLESPVNHDDAIYQSALDLLRENWRGQAVRLIGVGISGLTEKPTRQLSLWDAPQSDEERKLQATLDTLKDRFGEKSIQRGSTYRHKRDE